MEPAIYMEQRLAAVAPVVRGLVGEPFSKWRQTALKPSFIPSPEDRMVTTPKGNSSSTAPGTCTELRPPEGAPTRALCSSWRPTGRKQCSTPSRMGPTAPCHRETWPSTVVTTCTEQPTTVAIRLVAADGDVVRFSRSHQADRKMS